METRKLSSVISQQFIEHSTLDLSLLPVPYSLFPEPRTHQDGI